MLGKIEGKRRREWPEIEKVGWHHWCNGHELGQTPGDGEGQGSLACCSHGVHSSMYPMGLRRVRHNWKLNNNKGFDTLWEVLGFYQRLSQSFNGLVLYDLYRIERCFAYLCWGKVSDHICLKNWCKFLTESVGFGIKIGSIRVIWELSRNTESAWLELQVLIPVGKFLAVTSWKNHRASDSRTSLVAQW